CTNAPARWSRTVRTWSHSWRPTWWLRLSRAASAKPVLVLTAVRRVGCTPRGGRHSSPRTGSTCRSAFSFPSISISHRHWASSSHSRRWARLLLRHRNRWRTAMNDFELPEVFDPSQYEGTADFVPIRPSWQSAQIVEVSRKEAQNNSSSTYILAVFEIIEGEHKGRKIFQNITLTNQNQQAVEIGQRLLTDICNALKIGPLKNLEVLLYKPMKVRVGIKRDKDGVYPDRNQITQVRAYDFVPKRGGGSASVTAPAAPSAGLSSPSPSSSTSSAVMPGGSAPWRQQQ